MGDIKVTHIDSTGKISSKFANNRNNKGFFVVTEETENFKVPDPKLDQVERINQAIEIFEDTLDNKPKESNKVFLLP
jgi:hypothetical protein